MRDKENISVPVRKPNPSILCPVCGGTLCVQIPDLEAVVEEQLYQLDTVSIIASEVIAACKFEHILDEDHENCSLDNPHPLVSLYRVVFDGAGLCTVFDFLGIRPG